MTIFALIGAGGAGGQANDQSEEFWTMLDLCVSELRTHSAHEGVQHR